MTTITPTTITLPARTTATLAADAAGAYTIDHREPIRLYGSSSWEPSRSAVLALLFREMVRKIGHPVGDAWIASDLFHDAVWLNKVVTEPEFSLWWMPYEYGTNIGFTTDERASGFPLSVLRKNNPKQGWWLIDVTFDEHGVDRGVPYGTWTAHFARCTPTT